MVGLTQAALRQLRNPVKVRRQGRRTIWKNLNWQQIVRIQHCPIAGVHCASCRRVAVNLLLCVRRIQTFTFHAKVDFPFLCNIWQIKCFQLSPHLLLRFSRLRWRIIVPEDLFISVNAVIVTQHLRLIHQSTHAKELCRIRHLKTHNEHVV